VSLASQTFVLPIAQLTQPLDLASTLACGQCFRWRVDDGGAWNGVVGRDLVRLSMGADGLIIESSTTPAAELAESLVAYLRLDDDLPGLHARLGGDPHLREAFDNYPGLRLMRQEPWETLAGFILSSTSNIPRISKTVELLSDTFGDEVELDGIRRRTFASAESLAEAGEQRLRELGCGFRAPYLAGAAEAVATGRLPLDELRGAPYEDVVGRLTELKGVGEKIADCAMLFSLDRLEAFPADRWVRKVLTDLYDLPANISYDGAREWAWERWGGDAGYANQYLFWNARQSTRPMRISQ
jgi:N-glycosylase/DNA lyase